MEAGNPTVGKRDSGPSLACVERWTNRGRHAAIAGRRRLSSRDVVTIYRRFWIAGWEEETLKQRLREGAKAG